MLKEGIQKIILSKSKTFLAFCFCFIAGAGLASLISNFQFLISLSFYLYISLFLFTALAIVFWNKLIIRFGIVCFVFFIFGVWRFAITIPDCDSPDSLCSYNGRKVEIVGVVKGEPEIRTADARYTVSVERVGNLAATGKILVTTKLYPSYTYGEQLKMLCNLQKPDNKDEGTFRYDKYLARYGVWSVCSFPKFITVIPTKEESLAHPNDGQRSPACADRLVGASLARDDSWMVWPMRQIFRLKFAVKNQISRLWNEPESSLMEGLLYGSKSGLPPEIIDDFNKTGVSHIIAVSGFNITIIVTALMFVLIRLGLWRQQAYFAVVSFVIIFVIFTGATASVVRAGIMGLLVLTAQYIGRLSRIGNVLVFTAAAMMLVNPYVLVWDAGFQLSFLATMGLVYISPVLSTVIPNAREESLSGHNSNRTIEQLNNKNGKPWLRGRFFALLRMTAEMIREPFLQTLSAIIATLPLILYQFGRLSLVAPLVNILILWTVPLLMLVGFVAIVLGFIFFPLGQLVAWAAHFGLRYVIMVVEWFGNKSWAAVEFQVPWWGMVGMYTALIIVIARRARHLTA